MSIASEITRLQNAKASLKSSIEAKGVTVADDAKLDAYPELVDSIQQGGGALPDELDDVIFIDWDGSLVAHYSKEEFAELTEMPANPTREGYTSQGWNYTLADAKTVVASTGDLVIGQCYVYNSADNKTKITIDATGDLNMQLYIGLQTASSAGTIDWGDGNTEPISSESYTEYTHSYSSPGIYTIKISAEAGTLKAYGVGYGSANMFSGDTSEAQFYASKVKEVVLTPIWSGNAGMFRGCGNLERVMLTSSFTFGTSSYGNTFGYCSKLSDINFPLGTKQAGNSFSYTNIPVLILSSTDTNYGVGSYMQSLQYISGTFSPTAFSNCYSLVRISGSNLSCYNNPAIARFTASGTQLDVSFQDYKCNVKKIKIADTIASLGNSRSGFTGISELDLSNTIITTVPSQYFSEDNYLQKIILPSTCTTIAGSAFSRCSQLYSVNFPNNLSSIGNSAFSYTGIKSVDLSLTSITTIPNYAFRYCYFLSSVVLPSNLISLGSESFSYASFSEIVLPATLTTISSFPFYEMRSLYKVTCLATAPPSVSSNFLPSCVNVIYVPAASVETYKGATNWIPYANIIKAIPE